MKQLYSKLKTGLVKSKKKETKFSRFLRLLYRFFSHELVDAAITIIGSVVITVMLENNYTGFYLYVTIAIYCTSIILIALAKIYRKERVKKYYMLRQALFGINKTLRAWAVTLQECAKSVFHLDCMTDYEMQHLIDLVNFQNAAFEVCENLKNTLSNTYGNDNIYITVYQKESYSTGDTCRMIAYSGEHEPSTYGDPYDIPPFDEQLLGKIEYHSYLFSSNVTDISVLPDNESVRNCFVFHPKSIERETEIQQYIAVPIAPAGMGVTFLLQIDSHIEGLFGKTKSDVKSFANNVIYPFAQFLHMIYEQSRTVEQILRVKEYEKI